MSESIVLLLLAYESWKREFDCLELELPLEALRGRGNWRFLPSVAAEYLRLDSLDLCRLELELLRND